MKPRYAHDGGERLIPIGEAYALDRWYRRDVPPVVIVVKPWPEVIARVVCAALLVGLSLWTAAVGVAP